MASAICPRASPTFRTTLPSVGARRRCTRCKGGKGGGVAPPHRGDADLHGEVNRVHFPVFVAGRRVTAAVARALRISSTVAAIDIRDVGPGLVPGRDPSSGSGGGQAPTLHMQLEICTQVNLGEVDSAWAKLTPPPKPGNENDNGLGLGLGLQPGEGAHVREQTATLLSGRSRP